MREEHRAEVDALVAKFARDHAQSDISRLHSQVKAKEVRGLNLEGSFLGLPLSKYFCLARKLYSCNRPLQQAS